MEKESCILNQEFVNKFADFLCQEISENNTYKTKLSVVDCNAAMNPLLLSEYL